MRARMLFGTALAVAGFCFLSPGLITVKADDPARFLTVTNWYASLTRTLQSSGSGAGMYCSSEWSFSHSGSISTQLKFLPGPVWTDAGVTNKFLAYSIHDTATETCGDESDIYTADDGQSMQVLQFGNLTIDLTSSNYTLGMGYLVGPYDATVNGDPFPSSAITWVPFSAGPITEPLPNSGMVLQGIRHYPLQQSSLSDGTMTIAAAGLANEPELLNGELVVSWTLTPMLEQLEVVIESDDYQGWLPEGNLKDLNKRGQNPIFFTARVQTTNGTVPLLARAKNFKFELLNVSKQPGVCLNRPSRSTANTNPDLKFESDLNQAPFVAVPLQIQNSGMKAITADGEYVAAVAGVSSFDFGSFGELKVTANVNGQDIVGYWHADPTKEQKPVLIPRRQPNSLIADKWKEDNNATSLADDDDNEDIPEGDGHHGDGLSLYEEYRGFSENLKHIRGDPVRKELFVCDRIGNGISLAGIQLFEAQSGLKLHSQMRLEEFNVDSSGGFDTTINFNHGAGAPHAVDQHGVRMMVDPNPVGYNYSFGPFGGTPVATGPILIDAGPSFGNDGWQTVNGSNGRRTLSRFGSATVAHELAHTCAVWHHGDGDETVAWKKVIVYENGAAHSVIQENFQNIVPLNENGSPAPLITGSKIIIGVPHGQHSGDEDCMMRYVNATAYRAPGNVRYVIDEIKGFTLCTSPIGTGVNAPNHIPQSRYGDAAAKRGNCKSQICVNDLDNLGAGHLR